MIRRQVVVLVGLLATGLCWAVGAEPSGGPSVEAGVATPAVDAGSSLRARQPVPKTPTWRLEVPVRPTGRVIVKFVDAVQCRVAKGAMSSARGMSLTPGHDVCEQYGLTPSQALRVDGAMLRGLEERAAGYSGKAQPDLQGIVAFTPRTRDLLPVAQAFNEMAAVEWVTIEEQWTIQGGQEPEACCFPATDTCVDLDPQDCTSILGLPQGPGSTCEDIGLNGCPDTGQCCFPEQDVCLDLTIDACMAANGQFRGVGGVCAEADACDLDCGATMESCFTEHDEAFCDDTDCCELVCSVDPFCCDVDNGGVWDLLCVNLAQTICAAGDPCSSPFNDTCFESHPTPGCNNAGCCSTVCAVEMFCCDITWDENCAALATAVCNLPDPPDPGISPDFAPLQGYLRTPGYNSLPTTPGPLAFPAPDFLGFGGQGWRMEEPGEAFSDFGVDGIDGTFDAGEGNGWYDSGEPFVDFGLDGVPLTMDFGEGNGGWDAPNGLYPLSRELFAVFGVGETTPTGSDRFDDLKYNTRGKGIKVAVIEWAWYGPEPYTDVNVDGVYSEESFLDVGEDGMAGTMDPGEGDGCYTPGMPGEPFSDFGLDGIPGTGDIGEGNGAFDAEPFTDVQLNGCYDGGHEDLDVINEPGQTLVMVPEITEPDHATACLSIINGQDNGFGVTGVAPEAEAYFFPLTSIEDGPRELEAFLSCYNTLGPGDVVSCSFGPGCSLNNDPFSWTLLRVGSDLGILTCVAAANACLNLDDCLDLGDSGACVVGACSPGVPYYRLAFSNHFQATFIDDIDFLSHSNVVHCSAWGLSVASAGYGAVYFPTDPNTGFGDPNRSYTNAFGGTSAATPQIAGLAACYSGLVQQFYGIPLMPEQIRQACRVGIPQGRLTIDGSIGGFDESVVPCALDRDPDEGPNQIGRGSVYPRTSNAFDSGSSFILNQNSFGFDEAPFVDDLVVIRGSTAFGNVFSVKANDGNYIGIDSIFTERSHTPALAWPLSKVQYFASAQMVDIAVIAHPDQPIVSSLQIITEFQDPPVDIIWIVEAFDFILKRWVHLDIVFFQAGAGLGADVGTVTFVPNPNRYFGGKDAGVQVRATAYAQNFSEDVEPFRLHVDLFNVFMTSTFGGNPQGGGGGLGGGNNGG